MTGVDSPSDKITVNERMITMDRKIHLTVFCEHNQDRFEPVLSVYPKGIHSALAQGFLEDDAFEVRIATQDMPEHGLSQEVLDQTDVIVWWSHIDGMKFDEVVADRVCKRVVEGGMGFIALHSSIFSKPWQKMVGIFYDTGAWGRYRATPKGERSRLWVVEPGHPILNGIQDCIELPQDEMYGEPLFVTTPDKVIMIAWWEGGEVCRSGCIYERGRGKLFMFTPGHEEFPIYYREDIRALLRNAARWMAPDPGMCIPPRTDEHLCGLPREDLSHCM
jgi:trehalose utilization protein